MPVKTAEGGKRYPSCPHLSWAYRHRLTRGIKVQLIVTYIVCQAILQAYEK